jgi:hypothetical protein
MDIPFSGFQAFKLLDVKGVKMSENTPIYPLFPAQWHINGTGFAIYMVKDYRPRRTIMAK